MASYLHAAVFSMRLLADKYLKYYVLTGNSYFRILRGTDATKYLTKAEI